MDHIRQYLRDLTQTALVAFSVRCAMRVRPLYRRSGAVDRAIELGAKTVGDVEFEREYETVFRAVEADSAAVSGKDIAARYAAEAALCVVGAAREHYRQEAAVVDFVAKTAENATYAVRYAAELGKHVVETMDSLKRSEISDLLRLSSMTDSAIDVSESGPLGQLWVEYPKWWAESNLITDRLSVLPPRASVAFAARCAMRVRPLCEDQHLAYVEQMLAQAASFAAATDQITTAGDIVGWSENAGPAENAALFAGRAVYRSIKEDKATSGIISAASRAAQYAELCTPNALPQHHADLQKIEDLFVHGDRPFDISESGPLGPLWDEYPEWWPSEINLVGHGELVVAAVKMKAQGRIGPPPLEVYLDPGDAPQDVIEDVLKALSDLHVAAGGEGLEFSVDDDNFVLKGDCVE